MTDVMDDELPRMTLDEYHAKIIDTLERNAQYLHLGSAWGFSPDGFRLQYAAKQLRVTWNIKDEDE